MSTEHNSYAHNSFRGYVACTGWNHQGVAHAWIRHRQVDSGHYGGKARHSAALLMGVRGCSPLRLLLAKDGLGEVYMAVEETPRIL
jgi:hypothetical protein